MTNRKLPLWFHPRDEPDLGLSTMAKHIDRGYIHPHCVVLGTKAADPPSDRPSERPAPPAVDRSD